MLLLLWTALTRRRRRIAEATVHVVPVARVLSLSVQPVARARVTVRPT